ncbi:MAG: thiamine biosynthesis protein ThiS, partial [Candidatus Manganitrophaceae bacterium]
MRVKINGKQEEVQETTLFDLLKAKNIEPQMVTV